MVRLDAIAADAPDRLDEADADAVAADLRTALPEWADALDEARWGWLKRSAELLAQDKRLHRNITVHPTGGVVLTASTPSVQTHASRLLGGCLFFSDEDDPSSSGHFRSLLVDPMSDGRSHLEGVGEAAGRYAELCGLSDELVAVLRQSGEGHDLGKADPRFQAWLNGGNAWVRGPLLAKSPAMAQGRTESRRARERAGYPAGGRHELLSVRLLECLPEMLPATAHRRDLLLHLVESHHGRCRPFAPVVEDLAPVVVDVTFKGRRYSASSDTSLETIDAGPAERYWRLTRRYGWWGLAWLEAVLRLADHRRSEWEAR